MSIFNLNDTTPGPLTLSALDKADQLVKAHTNTLDGTVNAEAAQAEISKDLSNGWSIGAYVRRYWKGGKTDAAAEIKKTW